MGNCTSCSSRSVVKGVAETDPNSVFKYDKETRKIVYVGEDNVDGEIQSSETISASVSASASGENSDSGSIATTENNGSDTGGSNDHLNENLNNVRSLLGEIAEYLDEDESTYATGSVAGSQRSGSVTTTPTGNRSHDNSVISTQSRQTVSPLLFDADSVTQTPYTNEERSKKFEELVKLSKEQKMVENARSRLCDSPEADLVYKNPRNLYEDDSLLARNPSDEQCSPENSNYIANYVGREELEREKKDESWSRRPEGFDDDDQSDKTSLAGIEHVLSEDISESESHSCERDYHYLANLLPSGSDPEDVPTDEEDYGAEDPLSPNPKVTEGTKPPSPSASDANTSNISFGSFMHVSYVEGDQQQQEDKVHEAKTSGTVERDLIIFSPDIDSMKKSVVVTTVQQQQESDVEESTDDDDTVSQPTTDEAPSGDDSIVTEDAVNRDLILFSPDIDSMKKSAAVTIVQEEEEEESDTEESSNDDEKFSQSTTDEALSGDDSIVTDHAVHSSMMSELVVANRNETEHLAEDKCNDEGVHVLEDDEETQNPSSDEEYSEEGSDATQLASNTSMISELVVPTKKDDMHVGNEISYDNQTTNPLTVDKVETVNLSSPTQEVVPFTYEDTVNDEEKEQPPLKTLEKHAHIDVTEIAQDIICPPQKEINNTFNSVAVRSSDHSKEQNNLAKANELEDEKPSSSNVATPLSLEMSDEIIEELQTDEKVAAESIQMMERKEQETHAKLESIETVVRKESEDSLNKEKDDMNDDVIEKEDIVDAESKVNSSPAVGDYCVESNGNNPAVATTVVKENEEIVTMDKEDATIEIPENDEKGEVTYDVTIEECVDSKDEVSKSITEDDDVPVRAAKEKVSCCTSTDSAEKMEDNINASQEGSDDNNMPSDEYYEDIKDVPNSNCDSLVDVKGPAALEMQGFVVHFDLSEKGGSGATKEDDKVSIEKNLAAEVEGCDLRENEIKCSVVEEDTIEIESSRKLDNMENMLKALESLQSSEKENCKSNAEETTTTSLETSDDDRAIEKSIATVVKNQKAKGSATMKKLASTSSRNFKDMENKFKELESLQYSERGNCTINAKMTTTTTKSPETSNENRILNKSTAPVVKNHKVKGSTTTKKHAPNNQAKPKPRTPPRRHPTPTKASILRQQHLNGKNNDAVSRGRSLTSRSRPSHRENGSRRIEIGDDASIGSTSSLRSNRSGKSNFNRTPPRTRRNSLNLRDSPDDVSIQSFRSARTPLTVTPGSLPWDEKDLRRKTMSPAGSVCSFSSNLSDPEFIRESRKVAHQRVVAVRSADKDKKNAKCNRKWDTTLFEKKKGCIRCLALASKKERCQYLMKGRHVSIAITSGGCTNSCFPTKEFLRGYPELELDDDEDVPLCRICFNAIHR